MQKLGVFDGYSVERDNRTGIALVSDGSGMRGGVHASIDATGSVRGMKARGGGWGKKDRVRRAAGFQFNIDTFIVSTEADKVSARFCECDACRERRARKEAMA